MYDNLSDPDKKMIVGENYRSVLLKTRAGRELFTHMLAELGVLETTEGKTEKELGRYDYAIHLLDIMSVPNYQNVHRFVQAIGKWPVLFPKEEGEDDASDE